MTQTAEPRTERETPQASGIDRYFGITAQGSTIPREVRAGFTTWLMMSHILFATPRCCCPPSRCRTPSSSC
jgi:AGZA family xanthine/uracil permease-like MFS transporter